MMAIDLDNSILMMICILQTPGSPRVPPSRVSQLKKEEAGDVVAREVANEKEFQSTLQISASWEDLSLVAFQS